MKAMAIALTVALAPSMASAAGWYLVLHGDPQNESSLSPAVIPVAYPTKAKCIAAGNIWAAVDGAGDNFEFVCIPAP